MEFPGSCRPASRPVLYASGFLLYNRKCMPRIFEYLSYRNFLNDYYEEQKSCSSWFSYRYFAQKAGIRSPALFREVAAGKRNLTDSMIEKFSRGLCFEENEARYFRYLVLFNQSKISVQKQEYYAILRSMADHIKESSIDENVFEYFSKWYNPVVRELICLGNFKDNYDLIGETVVPAITERQARASVNLLNKLGFVAKTPDGRYRQTEPALTATATIGVQVIRKLNEELLDLAKESIYQHSPDIRHVSGVTLSCCEDLYDVLSIEIEAFKQRVITIVNNAAREADSVYHLSVQLFPLSKRLKSREPTDD